ncbi:hypothetical protein AWB82_06393 [Caballeronia glebae]|uniref:Uncharacterized protein n=1 Tax=Caballeronia glebae TaxID=1777143 RepID=A0A158D7V1_9BURK|nr:hypothetical protein [Caballeronia glebae]SAK90742.1 hypothetical protein AWB82_06393 [Caballeronia glebae]
MTKISHLAVFANIDTSWVRCDELSLTEDDANSEALKFQYDKACAQSPGAFAIDPVSLAICLQPDAYANADRSGGMKANAEKNAT